MRALIIGATGATGKDLVNVLLEDASYSEVVTFVRRPTGMTHLKLREVVTDFDSLEAVSVDIKGDVLFSLLGTTLKAAGSKEKQWHVDYEIPARFAEIAKANGVSSIVLLSAYGASANSRIFYSRIKGTLEDKIVSLHFEQHVFFRPGLLLRRDTDRMGERISAGLLRFLSRVGLAKKFKPLPTFVLAEKLAMAPKFLTGGEHIIELQDIFNFPSTLSAFNSK